MKNIILKTITLIAFALMCIFICAIDYYMVVSIIGMAVCGSWLTLFYCINEDKLLEEIYEDYRN